MKLPFYSAKAVLFDFDGTLTAPGAIDFPAVKQAIGCPSDRPILEFIDRITDAQERQNAERILADMETESARRSAPNEGAEDIVDYLRKTGMQVGIISRNSLTSIEAGLDNFSRLRPDDFDLIISRDDPVAPKPSGDGIVLAAKALNVNPREIIVVGDFIFDIQAAQAAGAVSVWLTNRQARGRTEQEADFVIASLEDLKSVIRMKQPLSTGKLPNDLLTQFLDDFFQKDPSVLIQPAVGEDTAAIDVAGTEVVVLKSDPITFATDAIGEYAVLVNANDIATAGAVPRWFLTTLLFPPGTTGAYIHSVIRELNRVCKQWGIALCGGHTEITDAVSRPVVAGMLAGTVAKSGLIDKRHMAKGDRILLTKGVAVEGTAIIAREFSTRLAKMGLAAADIKAAQAFLSQISILKEAQLTDAREVTAMHDVTEGGLATAMEELSIAGGHRLEVDMDRIHIFPQTEKICRLLGLHPLGLIGSGSLLICCRPKGADAVAERIRSAGISVSHIGRVREAGSGVTALRGGKPVAWPKFEVDEITRLFQNQEDTS